MPNSRGKKRSARKIDSRKPRKVIRVYSEGIVTEPGYLQILQLRYRSVKIDWVEKDSGKAAVTLIETAKKYKRTTKSANVADEIWCLWDVDNLTEAQIATLEDKARAAGLFNAISNPCFEVWLLLHEREQNAHIDIAEAQRQAKAAGLINGKKICCCHDWLHRQSGIAAARAIKLGKDHESVDCKECSNPSSGMHALLASIIEKQKEQDES